ncbi:VOC family protein [Streptomyces sp. NBC_01005]|uniref:VOC family protein n=1 Tax=unclassified Streptomyces TaxID=2593676 RepID=UPI002E3666B2|nr:VOC family protein [Streptomyces sp. NBC_01362]WSW10008.1 VOC family protein [Streptomyces sp. NBC_01005]WTC99517.1 VOC family protein [Streptomyces sp. NBC_01650]
MPLRMKLVAITLDCPDPPALAAFYQQATGLELHPESNADFAGLNGEDGLLLGFQKVDGHRAPSWPGQTVPQQLHICFDVEDDLDEAEARLLELGAAKPEFQPHDEARARVFTDPAGHPFCLVKN